MDEYSSKTSPKCKVNDLKKITKLIHEIYPNNPGSVIYGYLHHSQEGQKNLKDYFSYEDKNANIFLT